MCQTYYRNYANGFSSGSNKGSAGDDDGSLKKNDSSGRMTARTVASTTMVTPTCSREHSFSTPTIDDLPQQQVRITPSPPPRHPRQDVDGAENNHHNGDHPITNNENISRG